MRKKTEDMRLTKGEVNSPLQIKQRKELALKKDFKMVMMEHIVNHSTASDLEKPKENSKTPR